MKSRPKRRKPARRAKKMAKKRWFLKCFVVVMLVLLGLLSAWLWQLDGQIQAKFDGKKWAIPARVYARPLELYEGLLLKPQELQRELDEVGYQKVSRLSRPGQYTRRGQQFDIFTRDFYFVDKHEKAQRYSVVLQDGYVSAVAGVDDGVSLRLEPKAIGSIHPQNGEDRILVRLQEVPALLGQGLIAVEDQHFAHHYGISLRGIARAMLANLKAMAWVQGGSTLTQQLIKNFYLNHEKSLSRKLKEAFMAPLLELHYSKADILQAYMNEVYLGQSGARAIHGFGLASEHYFDQPLVDLQPHQMALLIAVVKGASYYNPWRYPERALARRNLVLSIMAQHQLLSEEQLQRYLAKPLSVVKDSALRLGGYPAFLEVVKQQLLRDYQQDDLQSEGLRIFTTLSPNVQALTESVVKQQVKQLTRRYKAPSLQAAAVITAVGSGEVLALVGDKNPRYQGFNRAYRMRRPIGSLVKPFVFLSALADTEQYSWATKVVDEPLAISLADGTWRPRNFDKKSHGEVLLYQSLVHSYNQSTVAVGMDVGVSKVVATLRGAGLRTQIEALPSLLLGALELSPLEVSHLYHTLAADGVYTPLRTIRHVVNADHQPLKRYPLVSEARISAELSYLLHKGLQLVMTQGTGKGGAQILPAGLAVAGKTGTSNDQRDSWFAGYSGDHLGVVWLGYDNNSPTPLTGSRGALPVWAGIFKQLSTRSVDYSALDGIEHHWIDVETGHLSARGCGQVILLPFVAGTQPVESVNCPLLEKVAPKKHWWQRWFQ